MRYLLIIFLFSILYACNPQRKEDRKSYTELLKKFKVLTSDTTLVESPNLEKSNSPFIGVRLDSNEVKLFPEKIRECNELYACYEFAIDSTHSILIVRACAEYAPTSIKAVLLDQKKGVSTQYFELADIFGDAGDFMSMQSWLFHGKDNHLKSFTYKEIAHDNRMDDQNDSTVYHEYHYCLLAISKTSIDTLSTDSTKLLKEYGNLLRRK